MKGGMAPFKRYFSRSSHIDSSSVWVRESPSRTHTLRLCVRPCVCVRGMCTSSRVCLRTSVFVDKDKQRRNGIGKTGKGSFRRSGITRGRTIDPSFLYVGPAKTSILVPGSGVGGTGGVVVPWVSYLLQDTRPPRGRRRPGVRRDILHEAWGRGLGLLDVETSIRARTDFTQEPLPVFRLVEADFTPEPVTP